MQFGGMPPASSSYRQQMTMTMPVYQPGQGMMINIGQYAPIAKHWKRAVDADGPTANGGTHDDELLCPQPAAQPAARVLLTSRGG
jgi:hypothetical protein